MHLHRPVAAAFAACATTFLCYPLDTRIVRTRAGLLTRSVALPNDESNEDECVSVALKTYDGVLIDAIGSTVATAVYFCVYEAHRGIGNGIAAAMAASVSSIVQAPSNVLKQRRQCRIAPTMPAAWRTILPGNYLLGLTKSIPKAFVKYTIYERCLVAMAMIKASPVLAGAISGAFASCVVTLFFIPIDMLRTYIAVERRFDVSHIRKWQHILDVLMASMLSNSIGHALLEWFAAR